MAERSGMTVSVGDAPLMEIEPVEAAPQGLVPVGVRPRQVIGDLLRLGLRVGTEGGRAASGCGTYRVVMSPELQAGLDSGAFQQLQIRGQPSVSVRDVRTGQIVGIGDLKPADAATLARVGAVVWQVAAIATQQHFLAEIDVKLGELARGIQGLQTFLDHDRHATLSAHHDQLRRDRDVAVALGDDLELQRLGDTAHALLTAAHKSTKHSILTLQTLHQGLTAKGAPATWAQVHAEAITFVYALGVGAEALAAATLAGEAPERRTRSARDLSLVLGEFRDVMDGLIGYFTRELGDHPPATVSTDPLWKEVLKSNLPYLVAQGVGRRLADRKHHHWKALAGQVVSEGGAAVARAESVGEAVGQLAHAVGGHALTLYADVDDAGVIQQVYGVPAPRPTGAVVPDPA